MANLLSDLTRATADWAAARPEATIHEVRQDWRSRFTAALIKRGFSPEEGAEISRHYAINRRGDRLTARHRHGTTTFTERIGE